MAMSQMDINQLRSDLTGDATQAADRANSAFASRGAPEESSFSPKTLRIKNQAFGQAELEAANSGIEKLISHLKTEAAFKDQAEAGVFEVNMRKKLNQYKLEAIRQAGEVEKRMAKAGIDQAQRQKVLQGISGLSSAAAFAIGTGIGGKPAPDSPIADSMQAPEVGSQFNAPAPSLTSPTATPSQSLGVLDNPDTNFTPTYSKLYPKG